VLKKVMAGMAGAVVLAGAYLIHEGAIRVRVDEQGAKGNHLHLFVPAGLVPAGMMFVPEAKLREVTAEARPWLPAVQAASGELARYADCDLVEVRDADEHVYIAKRGALLIIDVHSPQETVHISFPLKMLEKVAQRLGALGPVS